MNEQNKKESVLFSQALDFAALKHAGQVRKDGTPYIFHPIRVARLIEDAGYDINYQMAGLFHDLLEDTDTTEDEIKVYGEGILDAVKLVSKNYCENKKKYLNNILLNRMASVVKNADRIDNLWEACYSNDKEFQKRYLENSQQYRKKFSQALDYSITRLSNAISGKLNENKRNYPTYSYESMELYSDYEKRRKKEITEKALQLLEVKKNSEQPDRNNLSLAYFETEDLFLYCGYKIKKDPYLSKVWYFSEVGWIPCEIDLYETYGYNLMEVSREFAIEEMKYLKENGEVCDFVTEDDV